MGTRRQEKEREPQGGTDETNSRERTKGVWTEVLGSGPHRCLGHRQLMREEFLTVHIRKGSDINDESTTFK